MCETITDAKYGCWAPKTCFTSLPDGRLRRMVKCKDGTIEKDEVIPATKARVVVARASTGLSQSRFTDLMGVSVRTLQDWTLDFAAPVVPLRPCCASPHSTTPSCARRQFDYASLPPDRPT